MNVSGITLWQVIITGLVSLGVAVIAGIYAYRQATKVAERQGDTSITVKKLENDGAVHGYLHADLTAARLELKEKSQDLMLSIKSCAHAESEVTRLTEKLAEVRAESAEEIAELKAQNATLKEVVGEEHSKVSELTHAIAQLQTAKQGWDFWLNNAAGLRHLANDIDRKNGVLPELPPR